MAMDRVSCSMIETARCAVAKMPGQEFLLLLDPDVEIDDDAAVLHAYLEVFQMTTQQRHGIGVHGQRAAGGSRFGGNSSAFADRPGFAAGGCGRPSCDSNDTHDRSRGL